MTRMLLTPVETAEALSVSRAKVYELMASRQLPSIRIGGSRRVSIQALEEFIDKLARAEARA
jgi:excisionase family DNA binding protein